MKDKYDEAIEYLATHPNEIYETWNWPPAKKAGCLFLPVAPDSGEQLFPNRPGASSHDAPCGCLTMVHNGRYVAWTDDLTEQIRKDNRIPDDAGDITVKDLEVFAEWQRKIDKELNR